MKIGLIYRKFSKDVGVGRYVVELAERFVKEHETHLLTTDYDYEIPNLIVHKKPMIKKPYWLQAFSDAYYNTKYSEKIKKAFDIDLICDQAASSWKCDIVTMHSCHKAWLKYYKSWGWLQNARAIIDPLTWVVLSIEKRVIEKGSKKIIAVSEGVKREILGNYDVLEEKITVIPNGVDLEEFKPDLNKRRKIREKHGFDENEIILMFSGYEFKRKGLKYLIEALPKIRGDVKLLLVGKDNPMPYKKLASKLGVSNKIIFTGFVPDISEYYAASDIFVFPTAYEAFSLATLEAVASGLAILATKVNGTEELIKHGYNGFFIKRDPRDIAEKINLLIKEENLRKQMGKNARKTAEKYSWDIIAERTLKIYEEVLRK
ncbi:MAG: glycosyltransferase family 4 protein [Promethearchaeota archaeon]